LRRTGIITRNVDYAEIKCSTDNEVNKLSRNF
jgi:hypothetical protein